MHACMRDCGGCLLHLCPCLSVDPSGAAREMDIHRTKRGAWTVGRLHGVPVGLCVG